MAASAARAAGVLRERISRGGLRSGTRLVEAQLSDELRVSRNTLREAFALLEGEALLVREPNRGVRVTTLDAERITELYRVRRMVELAAITWGDLGAAPLGEMRAALERAMTARARGEGHAIADANQDFHRALASLSGSSTLATVVGQMLALMRLAFGQVPDVRDFHSEYVDVNARVLERLEAGDREGGTGELRASLARSEEYLLARVGGQRARADA